MGHVFLATEDELTEALADVLAREAGFETTQYLRKGGFGYLKSNIHKFCNLAHTYPVLLLSDLDRRPCPSELVRDWLGKSAIPDGLLFRVVVREIESWLLADHIAMRALFGARVGALPRDPDNLSDPKRALLTLAAAASRDVRAELLAENGAIASQGFGYNARLSALIRQSWDSTRAAQLSPSLARTKFRLAEFAARHLKKSLIHGQTRREI